jgi:hypothetical protein
LGRKFVRLALDFEAIEEFRSQSLQYGVLRVEVSTEIHHIIRQKFKAALFQLRESENGDASTILDDLSSSTNSDFVLAGFVSSTTTSSSSSSISSLSMMKGGLVSGGKAISEETEGIHHFKVPVAKERKSLLGLDKLAEQKRAAKMSLSSTDIDGIEDFNSKGADINTKRDDNNGTVALTRQYRVKNADEDDIKKGYDKYEKKKDKATRDRNESDRDDRERSRRNSSEKRDRYESDNRRKRSRSSEDKDRYRDSRSKDSRDRSKSTNIDESHRSRGSRDDDRHRRSNDYDRFRSESSSRNSSRSYDTGRTTAASESVSSSPAYSIASSSSSYASAYKDSNRRSSGASTIGGSSYKGTEKRPAGLSLRHNTDEWEAPERLGSTPLRNTGEVGHDEEYIMPFNEST